MSDITDVGPTVYIDRGRDRRHRAFVRDLKRASAMPSYRGLSYGQQVLLQAQLEVLRAEQEDVVDYLEEKNTPGTARVRERLRREKMFQQGFQSAAEKSADLLNIKGPPPTKKELKQQETAQRLASGLRRHFIADPNNPQASPAWVDVVGSSHLNLADNKKKGTPRDPDDTMRIIAADRFKATFDLATLGKASNAGNMERVDTSGRQSSAAEIALEAETELKRIRDKIGDRHYDLIHARIAIGASTEDIRKNGGQDHTSNNFDLKVALNALVYCYDRALIVDRTWQAAREIIKKSGMGLMGRI